MARTKAFAKCRVTYDGDNLQSHLNTGALNATVEGDRVDDLRQRAMEQGPGRRRSRWTSAGRGQDARRLPAAGRGDAADTLKTLVYFVGPSGSRVTYTWTAAATTARSSATTRSTPTTRWATSRGAAR